MKTSTLHILLKGIKVTAILSVVAFASMFIMAMKAQKLADDVWKQLGIAPTQADMNIRNSFIYGDFYYGGAKLAKNIAVNDRAAVIKQLVSHAREYYAGQEFKKAYDDYRKRTMPQAPKPLPITAESIKESEKKRLERNLATAENNLNSTNPKIKNGAPSAIERIKKELAALEDPNNPTIKRQLDNAARSYEAGMKQYQEKLKKYEEDFPADHNVLLAKRLQQVLDITADVDYDAELKEVYKKMKFVNPVYEKKPAGWKLAYRAGKETTGLVRAEAEKWLKELKSF